MSGSPSSPVAAESVESVPDFVGGPREEAIDTVGLVEFGEFPSDGGFDLRFFEESAGGGSGSGFAEAIGIGFLVGGPSAPFEAKRSGAWSEISQNIPKSEVPMPLLDVAIHHAPAGQEFCRMFSANIFPEVTDAKSFLRRRVFRVR